MRLAREIDNQALDTEEFAFQAETLVSQFPELLAITWVDSRRRVLSGYTSPSAPVALMRSVGSSLSPSETDGSFDLARDLRQPIYSRPLPAELRQGLDLTGFFLERHVFWPHNKPLPPARSRFMESLQR